MRIACPACEAEYDVPDTIADSGRKVRCARCQTVWVASETANGQSPPAPTDAAPAPAAESTGTGETPGEPEPPATDPSDAFKPLTSEPLFSAARYYADLKAGEQDSDDDRYNRLVSVGSVAPWIAAWVLSLALVGGAAWAGAHWRADVIRLWPASERLYAVLGSRDEAAATPR